MKTLVVGHVTHDHYQGGFLAGGCAFYGVRVHAELSGQAHLVTVVGDDFECDGAIADLDATVVRGGETTVFANYYPHNGPRIQLVEALAPVVEPHMAPREFADADLIHLAPVMGEVDLLAWKEKKDHGLLAINVQGWIKVAGPEVDTAGLEEQERRGISSRARKVVQQPWRVTEAELRGVDIACLSEEDLIGQGDLLDRLVRAVPVVALTLGARGSRVYVDGQAIKVGIFKTDVVDPTGAGDVFAATFAHKLAAGFDPETAARYAAAASSIVIEDFGPRALNRLDELERRFSPEPLPAL